MSKPIWVVGGGLAGTEAAWQVASAGYDVVLYEMRPARMTPAHTTAFLAELVCSNSLKANNLENAAGLLKEELRRLGSLLMAVADETKVPAGGALAVDRHRFAAGVTARLEEHPRIKVVREEISTIPSDQPAVVATGPLTSPSLSAWLQKLFGEEYFYFFDAVAPIVTRESLDFTRIFAASRYGRGEAEYLNCPMNEEEYTLFWENLTTAEVHQSHLGDEEKRYFEGCMPVEVLAARGKDTLRFGPLKPVGLIDPATGRRPYAVVQLRPENREKTLYNMVGFQTNLRWGEQRRVFRLIPGLAEAEFVRYGVMHRNSFINAPRLLTAALQWKGGWPLFLAGQLIGVEGYVESIAAGLVAGKNIVRFLEGKPPLIFPRETAVGALFYHIINAEIRHFQPMSINFGLFPPLNVKIKEKLRKNRALAERALGALENYLRNEGK
ncbi:MAG TPA: methylenetetrahydrofolate--tRNA-(uracil(54)-C(5))-methyltransferase (FADH(2)-oxidizing) TrmFO [Firmicutes bacterium]|uniref:Methylenetetrahydrofolate--tRNA-(uracil-5-)-methyltransferase TrmFO n=1 Tax=Capillibacterium thermochitinicola TaxID=2699427 RepID=A0A8J6HY90_9FIRM|nr:methylenetetrahydrofolate--tRNA-(uracil(54)-C(5))-methyltransferase (FADH(2)-oxidizing) TrmFO [Capillibacterium thermochitinicola]MBA2132220.1 methylenetetrahydrofolate--tRNA-(uracil(54)-C(5))-methyltransferase (FADH(2)-oxidizing) TrmFO [Capillibacterium thermochitinicola]HHW11903.1 methylenetetrahydrofolate--tRNA-(uracil(54)-C(5))-methyltransferase (FADH(2)-oxidizing) TrmFO [Bacillota bacterium]